MLLRLFEPHFRYALSAMLHETPRQNQKIDRLPYNNLSFGFICPLELRESPRRAEIAMGFILKNMDPIAILSIRGFDAVQRADKPKTQVNKFSFKILQTRVE